MAPEKYLLIRKAALTHPLVPLSPGEEWAWGRAEEAGRAGDQCPQPQRLRTSPPVDEVRHSQTPHSGVEQHSGQAGLMARVCGKRERMPGFQPESPEGRSC